MKYTYLFLATFLILSSCKEEEIIVDPNPLESSLSCKIDGEEFSDNSPEISVNGSDMMSIKLSEFLEIKVYSFSQRSEGETIYFSNKHAGDGYLDVDMNVCPTTYKPVENVFWDTCPPGKYTVSVVNASFCCCCCCAVCNCCCGGCFVPCQVVLRTKIPVTVEDPKSSGAEELIGLKAFSSRLQRPTTMARQVETTNI